MPKRVNKEGMPLIHEKRFTEKEYLDLQHKVVENLVELQKVHTNLAEKFDKLSGQITNLLSLFELAARSFAEHPANQGLEKDKEFLDKIDRLLDQNKTIAKGLTLMEDRIKERVYGVNDLPNNRQVLQRSMQSQETKENEFQASTMNKPLPKF
jgi:hypothetical protein